MDKDVPQDATAPKGVGELVEELTPLKPGGRYVITGGGTGGHVYPAIAIADEIRRRDPTAKFLYVGVRGKSEASIVPRRGYPLRFVYSTGWPGGRDPFKLGLFAITLAAGILKAALILMVFRPRLIIGTGGYVSAPIMLAALGLRRLHLLRARTFVHEQNTFPGRLNLLIGRLVDRVGVSFPETLRYFPGKGVYVGYPVRREMAEVDREDALKALGIPAGKKVVFAFGGSQGARTINRAVVEALPQLLGRDDIFVIHGTGANRPGGYQAAADTERQLRRIEIPLDMGRYLRQDYFHNIEQIYAVADLVICRAGAGTLTEICARGLTSVVLPKANLPGDHQVKNARVLAQSGGARVMYERVDLTGGGLEERVHGDQLAAVVMELLDQPELLKMMGARAKASFEARSLDNIAEELARLAQGLAPHPQARRQAPEIKGPDLEAMGATSLVTWLTRLHRTGEKAPITAADREYLEYRIDGYLSSPAWQSRNQGVKLVGLLGYIERLPHLVYLLRERRRVGLLQRLQGGDFEQVGFIRRNIFDALIQLDVADPETVEAIIIGLADPYFEARSAAARCAAHFAERLGSSSKVVEGALLSCLSDDNFEVQIDVAQALGRVASEGQLLETFRPYFFHDNWRVRRALVTALHSALDRGLVDPFELEEALEEILITSYGFSPHFPLKAEMLRVGKTLARLKVVRSQNTRTGKAP